MPQGQIVKPESDDPEAAEDPDNPIELLFVQTANSGTFVQKDGRNILTLVEVSPTTIWFSDRPHRITGHEATDLFVAKWAEGRNNFADNPPNAALDILDASESSDVIIVELSNPVYSPESETLQYDVIILDEAIEGLTHYTKDADAAIPQTFSKAALFIDDADLDSVSTSGPIPIPGMTQFYGVDITKGISDPVKIALFDFTSDETIEVTVGDNSYTVPESLAYDGTDEFDIESHVYSDIKTMSKALSVSAGITYSSPEVDAEVDSTYSQDSSTSEKSYFALINSYDRKYRLSVVTGLEATSEFQDAVGNLPSEYDGNEDTYFDFLSNFGTHYTTSVDMGGIMQYWSQESDTESMSSEEFEISVKAKVNELVSSVSGSLDVSSSTSESESTSEIDISIKGSGGDSSKLQFYQSAKSSDSFDDWWVTIDDHPGQIAIKYNPIYELVTDSQKSAQVHNALDDYLRGDFGYQILLSNSENLIATTISIGTDSHNTEVVTYPGSVEKGGLIVIADATTGASVGGEQLNEADGINTFEQISKVIQFYEGKDGNYIYFIGIFTEFAAGDQNNFLWFEKIGATPFTDLGSTGESNFYMLVGRSDLGENSGQDHLIPAETVSEGEGNFADTDCEFSGSIEKTQDGFMEISIPMLANCNIPSSQFVQQLDVYITTSDALWAGTDDTVTLTLGGLDFNLDCCKDPFERGDTNHFTLDTSDKKLERSTITDVEINKSKDGWAGGWKLEGVKIEVDKTQVYDNQSINQWLKDNKRTWGPHSVS